MGFILSQRSLKNLKGVHQDLVKVVEKALEITTVDFVVTEGLRSADRQEQLVKSGASKTKNSRHLTGHAVDVVAWVNGNVSWNWKYYDDIASAFKEAAKELEVDIEWGSSPNA